MKFIKVTTLCLLMIYSSSTSAEINFRTATPNFSIEKTKNNKRINKATNNIHGNSVSYLSIENNPTSTYRQTIGGNGTNYYHRYSKTTTQSQQVSYNNHIAMKSYNVANRDPFDGGEVINTSSARYSQMGPPEEGPISDIIWPLLLFVGISLLKLRVKN